ncbi:MAG TPA: hypothetical protein PLN38_13880, partial [Chitinophagales bacterium]|nr:hypothetical protein [Chitinophagales bacterium]
LTFGHLGTAFTTSGINRQNGSTMLGNGVGGLSIGATNASGILYIYAGNSSTERWRWDASGNFTNTAATATAYFHLKAGTTTASTAPIKFTSGSLNTSAEVGSLEFLTDRLTFTTTTGTTRKDVSLLSYRGITALRTLDGSDELVNCTSGTYTVTLPTAVGFTGQYTVKNSGTGIITLATTSSQTIDGYASATLVLNQYDSYTLRSNNANWIIIK